MSPYRRALIIGMIGPLLQATGVVWDLLDHGVFARDQLEHVTFEHIVSGPAHLMVMAGFLVSCVCIPIAIELAATQGQVVEEAEDLGAADEAVGLARARGAE